MSLLTTLIPSSIRAMHLAIPTLAMIAMPIFAGSADSYRGTINLPVEARWDKTVLEPGRYTISVETNGNGGQFIYVHGVSTNVVMLAGQSDSAQASLNSRLTLVNIGGTYVVKRFEAGRIGKSFKFRTPKGLSNEPIRASAASETFIEVAAAGTR